MKDIWEIFFNLLISLSLFLCSSCNITRIVSTVKRRVLIFLWRFCERLDFTGFTGIFRLLSHSIFLIWPHFYDKSLEKYIRLIFLPHFATTTYGLYHSRYGFRQIHFRHLIFHVRLLCNMIVDIHCDLCIWMAPKLSET